jgi:3-oxoadipate enol-lactonase
VRDRLTSEFVEVEGGRLFMEEAGDGPAVILIHCCLLDRRQWDDQMASFPAAGYRSIRYDLRGFGRSPAPTSPWSPVEDLVAVLDHRSIERAAVVGNSCGGSVAVDAVLEYEDRFWALVPVAAGVDGSDGPPEVLRTLWKEMARLMEAGDAAGAQILELDVWAPPGRLPLGDDRIRAIAEGNVAAQAIDESLEREVDPPAAGRLDEVRVPTLVVQAETDVESIQSAAARMAAEIPGVRHVTIPGTDHVVNLRAPGPFDAVVLEFLDSVG